MCSSERAGVGQDEGHWIGYLGDFTSGRVDRRSVRLAGVDRPLVNGRVQLTRVIHNTATLGLFTSPDKARDRQRSEQPDNGYDNHDFHEGER